MRWDCQRWDKGETYWQRIVRAHKRGKVSHAKKSISHIAKDRRSIYYYLYNRVPLRGQLVFPPFVRLFFPITHSAKDAKRKRKDNTPTSRRKGNGFQNLRTKFTIVKEVSVFAFHCLLMFYTKRYGAQGMEQCFQTSKPAAQECAFWRRKIL